MLSMREMFYGEAEPVWVVKKENNNDKKGGDDKNSQKNGAAAKGEYSILSAIPYYPYYYPDYVPAPTKKDDSKDNKNKETKVELKVPICCGECEELVTIALTPLKGVKSVECNIHKEKVTVVATTASVVDILIECRKVFKKSRMWDANTD